MQVEVFDDKASFAHIAVGALSYFSLAFMLIFFLYEFVEYLYKGNGEPKTHYLGDLFEMLIGVAAARIVAVGLGFP